MRKYIKFLFFTLAICLLTACEYTEVEEPVKTTVLNISAAPMNDYGVTTRSGYTMWPEEENCIKTLAFFQFDPEGIHTRNELYNFRKFTTEDNPNGVLQASIEDIKFKSYKTNNTTICVVANVTEQDVNEFYNQYTTSTSTQVRLDEFKEWTHKFQYKEHEDSVGHLKQVCMFGYYDGTLEDVIVERLILGRLCSRIEITLMAENNNDFIDGVSFSFDNVPTEAYYFSRGIGVSDSYDNESFLTIVPSVTTDKQVYYFYIPGNSAQTKDEALKLNINFKGKVRTVTLCTLPPEQSGEYVDYGINRNSIYRFNLTLKKNLNTRAGKECEYLDNENVIEYRGKNIEVNF